MGKAYLVARARPEKAGGPGSILQLSMSSMSFRLSSLLLLLNLLEHANPKQNENLNAMNLF